MQSAETPPTFNFADILNGGSVPQGLEGWTNVLGKLAGGKMPLAEDVSAAMQTGQDVDASVQLELSQPTVQEELRNLTGSGNLTQVIQGSPYLAELAHVNPAVARIVQ